MRLLYIASDGRISCTDDLIGDNIRPYAILSHTWGEQEVTFDDLKNHNKAEDADAQSSEGYRKIRFCAERAKLDNLDYFWVDTCCIDKSNNTELSEAINSMFCWYQNAKKCYVYLADVENNTPEKDGGSARRWKPAFKNSRWFTRGWTLQELLAPESVEFFSKEGTLLGSKDTLKHIIHEVTGIPVGALEREPLSEFSIDERFSWADDRCTTREEDGAYCLLGIFGIHLPLIYGEKKRSALRRLRSEIKKSQDEDETESRSQSQKEILSKICEWLSGPDPSTNYHKAHKLRQANTGTWLLNSEKFMSWRAGAASRLWLYGIPGCGKTILSSTIIKDLLQHCRNDRHTVTVYFYFDFNDAQKQDPELMLRSLLCQLLQNLVKPSRDLEGLFSSCNNGQKPSPEFVMEAIKQTLQKFAHVYLVLDALDECTQRTDLMAVLETIAGWQLASLHLLMTSRRERDIETSLESYMEKDDTVCIQSNVVDKDIQRYVQQRLLDDKTLIKWNKDTAIRQEIETALMSGAHGMFRWAVCQLDTLGKCRNRTMLRNSLATLPPTLDQTYDRILCAIGKEDSKYAFRILQWLVFAVRPLSVREIAEVVAIDAERDPAFDRDEVLEDPLEVLNICSSLVTITEGYTYRGPGDSEQIVALAHYSVQEYLVSERIKEGHAKRYSMQEVECHHAITKSCVGYLLQFQIPGQLSEEDLETFALASYSADSWSSHLQKTGEKIEETSRFAMRLLAVENPAYTAWLQLRGDEDLTLEEPLENVANPLYYAARLDLTTIARLLLAEGADVNAQGGFYGNALHAASDWGRVQVVELLIDAGAEVNAQSGYYGNALHAASYWAREQIVKLLIDAGAEVNAQGGRYGTALHAAKQKGHERIVRILLEAGATEDERPQLDKEAT